MTVKLANEVENSQQHTHGYFVRGEVVPNCPFFQNNRRIKINLSNNADFFTGLGFLELHNEDARQT